MVSSLILAGVRASGDPLALARGVPSKASIMILGRSMLGRVFDAVSDSVLAGPVAVSGLVGADGLAEAEAWPAFQRFEGAPGPASSVLAAVTSGRLELPLLITTCDHALLRPEIIDAFISQSMNERADLTVALAARETIEAKYPNVARTYLKLGRGAYSSCNLFLLKNKRAIEAIRFWQRAEVDRKQPWRIAWRFGIWSALQILVGRAGLDKTFEIASQRLGVTARPILLPYADAAVDVDKPSDLELVQAVLAGEGI